MNFKEINIREVKDNPVSMFSDTWAILTAGNKTAFNSMTVSWGGIGELWKKDVGFIFVRPQRHTYEFCEKSEYFTLSFLGSDYRKELSFFGAKSGREVDKFKETGLTPQYKDDFVYVGQADTVILCKKIAFQDIKPDGFLDASIQDTYVNNDYHRVYVGEILGVLTK